MKITKISSFCTLILIALVLAVLILLLFFIPEMAISWEPTWLSTAGNATILAIFLYISDCAAIVFMLTLFLILRSVAVGNPFSEKNVCLLRCLAGCCLVAFLDFSALIFLYKNFFEVGLWLCAVMLLFGTLCAFVLSQVFAKAVAYKSENDLTV